MKITIDRLFSYGLFTLAVLLPFNTKLLLNSITRPSLGEFDQIALFASDLLIFLVVILGAKAKRSENSQRRLPFYWMAWLLLVITCGSVYIAIDKIFVLFGVLRLLLALALWWTLINTDYSRRRLVLALMIGGAVSSLFALGQFFTQAAGANKWLGLAAHRASDLGTSVVLKISGSGDSERWLRAYGTLDHPNMLGGYLALILISGCWFYLFNKNSKHAVWSCILIAISAGGLYVSFSRSGLLAALLGITVLAAVNFRNYKKLLLPLGIILAVWAALSLNYGSLWLSRMTDSNYLEKKSINERAMLISEATSLIGLHPIAGSGYGNYPQTLKNYVKPGLSYYDYQPVHNTWLLVQAELGLIGATAYASIFVFMVIFSLFTLKLDRFSASLNLGLLAGLATIMSLDHWLWTLHFGIILYWLMSGLIVRNLVAKEPVDKMMKII